MQVSFLIYNAAWCFDI